MYKELQEKKVLIFGCGNTLMGDDGFGPAVADLLATQYTLPDFAHAEDVGTRVRELLFNITVLDKRPEHIIVLDAVDKPLRSPGEVFEIYADEIPEQKIADYSFHQFPTTNLLKELKELCGVKVTIIAAQVSGKLEEVGAGLSPQIQEAVKVAAEKVMQILEGMTRENS
ncbi:MAG: hydrogenase maturation protease [Candidatus Eremiobacteraeota bacterium]|nr:hydrogenase maturation protease [Candidatus Eremiobacteraeota bacterium]